MRKVRSARLLFLLIPGVALAATACQTPAPGGGSETLTKVRRAEPVSNAAPVDTRAELGRHLGLTAPTQAIAPEQFQLQDRSGRPLAGVTVRVANARLVTDAQGVVTLPPEAAAAAQTPVAIEAPGFVPQEIELVPGQAFQMTPVDPKRTAIQASSGGTAANSDGTMTVLFPPGTLTGDVQVAVTRMVGEDGLPGQRLPEQMPFGVSANKDSQNPVSLTEAGYRMADNRPLGTYAYAIDLPEGVSIAPGAAFTVKFKAEGRMADLLKARYDHGDTFADMTETVTRDEAGNFWLAMRVDGPAATAASGPAQRRLLAASCNTYSDQEAKTFQVKKQWATMIPGIEVPIWSGGHRTRGDVSANWVNGYAPSAGGVCVGWESAEQYERNGWSMQRGSSIPGWITLMTHHSGFNGGRCIYYQFDPAQYYCSGGRIYVRDPGYEWQTTYTTWVSKSINALVTWLSDDPRVSGAVPGASVSFSHSLSPVRVAPLGVSTAGDGYATTLGVDGSYGTASANLPAQASFTYSSPVSYRVDCGTVNLRIVKNMPRVTLSAALNGQPEGGTITLKTNLGDFPGTAPQGGVVKPSIGLDSASGNFSVNGAYQANANEWVEMSSGSASVGWNGSHTLAPTVWVSQPIRAALVYDSNDATLPLDNRPASIWGGKAADGYNVTFAHAQSGYAGKTRQEPLSFQGVSQASTWGIKGAASTVSASRTSNGVTFQGQQTGTVNGSTVTVAIPANLPRLTFNLEGTVEGAWNMTYKVARADGTEVERTTRFDFGSGASSFALAVPVEDALNQPGKHTFSLDTMISEDGNTRLLMPDNRHTEPFPTVSGLNRGGSATYPVTLKSTFVAPK